MGCTRRQRRQRERGDRCFVFKLLDMWPSVSARPLLNKRRQRKDRKTSAHTTLPPSVSVEETLQLSSERRTAVFLFFRAP